MISQCYTVMDKAVKAYLPPFFCRSKGEAIRSFSDAVNTKDHQFNRHYNDYVLFFVGEFDDSSAVFRPCEPERVIGAFECLADDDLVLRASGNGKVDRVAM